jgi:hypothetical protein
MTVSPLWGRFGQQSSPEDARRFYVAYEAAKAAYGAAKARRIDIEKAAIEIRLEEWRDYLTAIPHETMRRRTPSIDGIRSADLGHHRLAPAPKGFSFLLACVATRADEVLGDAETQYRKMILRLGAGPARWWYRVFVVRTIIRMVPGMLVRIAVVHKLFGL